MSSGRCLAIALVVAIALVSGGAAGQSSETGWFASFKRIQVAPVERSNTTQLIDAGVLDTDGFTEVTLSLGGEFKEGVPGSGVVGALLIPNLEPFDYLLRSEGEIVFPIEVTYDASTRRTSGDSAIFLSPQATARIAFPSYRVYLYNETESGATVSLFAYRSR